MHHFRCKNYTGKTLPIFQMGNACGSSHSQVKQTNKPALTSQLKPVSIEKKLTVKTGTLKRSLKRWGNFPDILNERRSELEPELKTAIKQLIVSKQPNIPLEILGPESSGKSSLVSGLLKAESDFIWEECPRVEAVVWIDVYSTALTKLGNYSDQTQFFNDIACLRSQVDSALNDHDETETNDQRKPPKHRKAGSVLVVVDFGPLQLQTCFKKLRFQRYVRFITISRGEKPFFSDFQLKIPDTSRKITSDSIKARLEGKPELMKRLAAFLLFQPGSHVPLHDVAVLWNIKFSEVEDYCLKELEGLVYECHFKINERKEWDGPAPSDDDDEKKQEKKRKFKDDIDAGDYYAMSSDAHLAVNKLCWDPNVYDLIIQKDLKTGRIMIHKLLVDKKGVLLKRLVQRAKGDETLSRLLHDLCFQKDSKNDTPVDLLISKGELKFKPEAIDRMEALNQNHRQLFDAIMGLVANSMKISGETDFLDLLLESNDPRDLFSFALRKDYTSIVEALLNHQTVKIDVNGFLKPHTSTSALALQIAAGRTHPDSVKVVERLLKLGAEVNRKRDNNPALIEAAWAGNTAVCKILVEHKAECSMTAPAGNYKECDEDITALSAACANGHIECAAYLMELSHQKGMAPTKRPIWGAVISGSVPLVKMLIEKGYDPNFRTLESGDNLLMIAIRHGNFPMVRLLVENGAKLDQANNDGQISVSVAVVSGQAEIAKYLSEALEDYGNMDAYVDGASLMAALEDGDEEEVSKLLAKGVDPNLKSLEPPLALTVRRNDLKLTAILLDYKASPDTVFEVKRKKTPVLCETAGIGSIEIVKLLLQKGADPNKESHDLGTALIHALQYGFEEVAEALLCAKADPNAKHVKDKDSALIMASRNGLLKTVKILLKHGADTEAKTMTGQTAIEVAERRGNMEIVEILMPYEKNEKKNQGFI